MKKKSILRYCLILVLNTAPFFLSCLLYEGGIVEVLLFPFAHFFINLVNYGCTKKISSFLFLNLAMLISSIASLRINTLLYYNYVSDDPGTLAVGEVSIEFAIVFISLLTIISIICRKRSGKKLQSKQ